MSSSSVLAPARCSVVSRISFSTFPESRCPPWVTLHLHAPLQLLFTPRSMVLVTLFTLHTSTTFDFRHKLPRTLSGNITDTIALCEGQSSKRSHLPLQVQSVCCRREWWEGNELGEGEKRGSSAGLGPGWRRAVNASHLVDRLTCGGQLGLMDTLLRLYRADVTGLKIIIPSLTMDKQKKQTFLLSLFFSCMCQIYNTLVKEKETSQSVSLYIDRTYTKTYVLIKNNTFYWRFMK